MSWSVDRRDFMRLLATVGASVTAAGCTMRKTEYLLERFEPEANVTPGELVFYATTCRECPVGCGMMATTHDGRVIKLEGNPSHPVTRGALCGRGQAGLQGLYNPDRVLKPLMRGSRDEVFADFEWKDALTNFSQILNRRFENGDLGKIAWLTGETADSEADLLELITEATGMQKPVNLQLLPETPLARAAEALFGYEGVPEFRIGEATLLVSVGADFIETWGNPVALAAGFTDMHAFREGRFGRAVYAGPRQSITATVCDEWIKLPPGRESAALWLILEGLVETLRESGASLPSELNAMPGKEAAEAAGPAADRLRELGKDLAAAEAPLVLTAGYGPDAETANRLALLINHLAGADGKTVRYPDPARSPRGDAIEDVRGLFSRIDSGEIEVLMIHQANPAFLLPETIAAIEKAAYVVCFTTQLDETANLADLVLPIHHSLEEWGDHAAAAGVVGLIQPAMRPMPKWDVKSAVDGRVRKKAKQTRSFTEVLLQLTRSLPVDTSSQVPWQTARDYFETRLETYHKTSGASEPLEDFKREAKRRGGIWMEVAESSLVLREKLPALSWEPPAEGLATLFFPHLFWFDGRGADKPWLQEVPESTTAVVWGTWAELHPRTAEAMGLKRGDAIRIGREDAEISIPALITQQVMPDVIAAPIGQGHESLGRWATGRGANPLRLIEASAAQSVIPLAGLVVNHAVEPGEGKSLVSLAGSQDQDDRELARTVSLEKAKAGDIEPPHADMTLYPDIPLPDHDWSMAIDLDACVGCGACSVACYAENNLAVAGQEKVAMGREMSWIRVEKYAKGDDARFLLVLCQQCHRAPCESVCPVHATYHNIEGLNAMVYNRCVGTRYCSNNCPYKVRRFNWFDYVSDAPLTLQYNPYVTVRERGMMEKCSFCVQRIRVAHETAKNEGRPIRDGEILPACAQTCPTRAITFGNILDLESRVADLSHDPRRYYLLHEIGTRPSVVYLKKVVRDQNAREA